MPEAAPATTLAPDYGVFTSPCGSLCLDTLPHASSASFHSLYQCFCFCFFPFPPDSSCLCYDNPTSYTQLSETTPHPVCRLPYVTVSPYSLHSICARLTLLKLQGGCTAWSFLTATIIRAPLPSWLLLPLTIEDPQLVSQLRARTSFQP